MSFFDEFKSFINITPANIEFNIDSMDSYIIYRDDKYGDTYLVLRKIREIAEIDFYEIEYYEIYDNHKKEKHNSFITHVFNFLEYSTQKRKNSFVITRNIPNRSMREIDKFGDVIYPFLNEKLIPISSDKCQSLYPDKSGIQYGFCSDSSSSYAFLENIIKAQRNMDRLMSEKIIKNVTLMDYKKNTLELFRHFYFQYESHRMRLYFLKINPLLIHLEFTGSSNFAPLQFQFGDYDDIKYALEELIEMNKLVFLFE